MAQQYNSCCATNIIGTPTQSSSLRWQYQSISRTYSQHLEMRLASHNPLLWVRPSNNRGLADMLCVSLVVYRDENNRNRSQSLDRQSYHNYSIMPLPVLSDIQLFVYHVVCLW